MPNEKQSTNEDRFARQYQRRYSGWSSLVVIAITIVVCFIVIFYFVR
jgi:hypothetical protein